MEKNLFDLMSKMYGEMQTGFSDVNSRLDNLETEVKKTNMIIENDIKPRIESLFDGYKQNSEAINRIEDDVKELRLSVNELHIKTIKNENNIISFNKRINAFDTAKH